MFRKCLQIRRGLLGSRQSDALVGNRDSFYNQRDVRSVEFGCAWANALSKASPARIQGRHWSVLAAALLSCCTVGPDCHPARPSELKVPEQYNSVQDRAAAAIELRTWWTSFDDPVLGGLIASALSANSDIDAALARLRAALAAVAGARGTLLPVFVATAGADKGLVIAGTGNDRASYRAGIDASWAADLFGANKRSMQVATASSEAAAAVRRQAGFGPDEDYQVVMPIKTVMPRLTGNREVRAFQVAVDPAYDTKVVSASIVALLRERRKIGSGEDDDFNIFDSKQLSDTLSGNTKTLTALLGSISAVSLIVGGIGIMNIVLVSVTERTREIGIRLAVGAVQSEVLLQFLVEAVALSCLGGIVGLILALIATLIISPSMEVPFGFDLQINLLAFLFAAVIGIVFGYFPARRAASLNPIDAMRHE